MNFDEVMELVVRGFEAAGVVVLSPGSVAAALRAAHSYRRSGWKRTYEEARRNVGWAILLGLEFLIVADIVMTITVNSTLESALTLGLIVLVRTFLSFSLEIELEGSPPWRRALTGVQSQQDTETSGPTGPSTAESRRPRSGGSSAVEASDRRAPGHRSLVPDQERCSTACPAFPQLRTRTAPGPRTWRGPGRRRRPAGPRRRERR